MPPEDTHTLDLIRLVEKTMDPDSAEAIVQIINGHSNATTRLAIVESRLNAALEENARKASCLERMTASLDAVTAFVKPLQAVVRATIHGYRRRVKSDSVVLQLDPVDVASAAREDEIHIHVTPDHGMEVSLR